jgi:hypothetical protein
MNILKEGDHVVRAGDEDSRESLDMSHRVLSAGQTISFIDKTGVQEQIKTGYVKKLVRGRGLILCVKDRELFVERGDDSIYYYVGKEPPVTIKFL